MKSEYDAFASDFSTTRTNMPWSEFDLILPLIKKNDRIADLGCGNGRLRQYINKENVPKGNYFGLDLSNKLLDIARKQYPEDHFFLGDFSKKLPFGADNFDVVTAIASFHHLLSKKDQKDFIKECHRILRKNGTLFITTWNLPKKHFWTNLKKGRLKNWIIPFGKDKHPRIYRKTNDKEIKKICEKNGFTVQKHGLFEKRNFYILATKK